MLTSRSVHIYGFVTIGVLLVLLCLVWFRLIDPSYDVPILIFAFLVILSRIILRILARRNEARQETGIEKSTKDHG